MRRVSKLAVTVVASLAILAAMVWFVGFRRTGQALLDAGAVAFGALGALMLLVLVLQTAAWATLGRAAGHKPPFRTLLGGSVVGMAGNIMTPSTYLGGEPAKVVYLGRRAGLPYQEVAGVVLLGKYLEFLSFLLFIGGSTVAATVGFRGVLFRPPNLALGVTVLALAGLAVGACLLLWLSLSRRWKPLTRIVGWLTHLPVKREWFGRLHGKTRNVEELCSRVFHGQGWAVVPALAFYALTHAAVFLKPLTFFALGWGLELGGADLALLFLATQVLLSVQLTPSGVGTLDGGLFALVAFTSIPVAPHQLAAYLLCLRFWDVPVVAVGAALAGRVGVGLLSRRHAANPAKPPPPRRVE